MFNTFMSNQYAKYCVKTTCECFISFDILMKLFNTQ